MHFRNMWAAVDRNNCFAPKIILNSWTKVGAISHFCTRKQDLLLKVVYEARSYEGVAGIYPSKYTWYIQLDIVCHLDAFFSTQVKLLFYKKDQIGSIRNLSRKNYKNNYYLRNWYQGFRTGCIIIYVRTWSYFKFFFLKSMLVLNFNRVW